MESLTHTQRQRKYSAMIRKELKNDAHKHLQYYFVRGFFHINNINQFETAKTICERITGQPFQHFTNSMCKLIQQD